MYINKRIKWGQAIYGTLQGLDETSYDNEDAIFSALMFIVMSWPDFPDMAVSGQELERLTYELREEGKL